MGKEKDLVLGKPNTENAQGSDSQEYMVEFEEIRSNVDTAMEVYLFLDQIDLESPEVLTWGITDELRETKLKSLQIIIDAIGTISMSG